MNQARSIDYARVAYEGITGRNLAQTATEIERAEKQSAQSEISQEIKRLQMAQSELEMIFEGLYQQLGGLLMSVPEPVVQGLQACAPDPSAPRSPFGQEMRVFSSRIETISMRMRELKERLAV